MVEVNKLIGLKNQAKKKGWAKFIKTPLDEKALLRGDTFSWDRFDHYRFFVEKFIKLSKGRWVGQPMKLLPWHEDITGSLFGWIREDHLRRFRYGYIEVPKKNSKSTLISTIGLYMLVGDGEGSPEVYSCANSKDQAAILWSIAADAVEASPALKKKIDVLRSTKTLIVNHGTFFKAWSSDKASKDGPNAHCILVDELHEWKGPSAREFWAKIRYAGIARDQPLCPLAITTAGDDKNSLCFEQRTAAERVMNGTSEDLAFYACIYGTPIEKIDKDPNYWKKEECWKKANPSYGLILKKEDFEADVKAVENDPPEKARFFRYRLGVWLEGGSPWLDLGVWDKNKGDPFTEDDLKGEVCFTGLDLSSVDDFTAIVHVFPYRSGNVVKFRLVPRIFCPYDTLAERIKSADVSLRVWLEKGYIQTTPGNAIDHQTIFDVFLADSKKFKIKEVGYDQHCAAWIIQEISKKIASIDLHEIGQSFNQISGPTKSFKAALLRNSIEHGGHPVLAWMSSNAMQDTNTQKEIRLNKQKSKDKIDGLIASIMGFTRAELGVPLIVKPFSPYSNPEDLKKVLSMEKPIDKSK